MKRITGGTTRAVVLCALIAGCSNGTDPHQQPITLEPITPTRATVTVGTAVLPSPAVIVRDSDGRPKGGVEVEFDLRYLTEAHKASSRTGSDGVASVPWTLGERAGTGSATAHVADAANIVFSVTGVAGPGARVLQNSGNGQYGLTGIWVEPVSVQVLDAYGNPVTGAKVRFTITKGGGRVTRDTAVTDRFGYARSGEWMLGEAGANLVVATVGDISAIPFVATAVAPGTGAVDALYTLTRPAGAGWNGSLTLTTGGRFTATSTTSWGGNTVPFDGMGQYAIAGPRILFRVEAGDWKPDLSIGDLTMPTFLTVSFSNEDYTSTFVYQRKP